MFEELSDTSRVDQEQIQQIATTNVAMGDLCQQLTETNQEQVKQIRKFGIADWSTHQAPTIERNQSAIAWRRKEVKHSIQQNMQAVWPIPQEPRLLLGARENAKNRPTRWVIKKKK